MARKTPTYSTEVRHPGLHKYRIVTAHNRRELESKVQAIYAQWDEQCERKQTAEARAAERARRAEERALKQKAAQEKSDLAEKLTEEAQSALESLGTILADGFEEKCIRIVDFEDHSPFDAPYPQAPKMNDYPAEPKIDDEKYQWKPTMLEKISKSRKAKTEAAVQACFDADHNAWREECEPIWHENDKMEAAYRAEVENWVEEKEEYENDQLEQNATIELTSEGFGRNTEDTERGVALAVDMLTFPVRFEPNANVEYVQDDERVIVDILLPNMEDLPTLKSVSYVKSRDSFKESFIRDSDAKKNYESVIYQIVMRVVQRVFALECDRSPIQAIVLNGRVHTVDASTGHEIYPCVLSLMTSRSDFEALNLDAVDPKTWFKKSKGVSASSIAKVAPIAPIIRLSREDPRFVDGYGVISEIDESENLAAMDWQDFENLVRELFEEEFSTEGSEVKVTRASRDGGVDAVIFDPDPIRGGKIVVQAKRYTNTVGVEAVRALYGTVQAEGALKGILITTADYGNDAHIFARGKPLALLNGANLKYLLEKHGHRARIDIPEAKKMLKEQQDLR